MFLLIDTSTKNAGIGVYSTDTLTGKKTWASQYNHSQELFVALESIFAETQTTMADVTSIGLALGPGGYSSVRSGVSVGKTIAYAQKVPIYGYNTHDLEATAHKQPGMKMCSVIEAGKSVLSYAVYDQDGQRIGPDQVSDINTIISSLDAGTLVCGEGVKAYQTEIEELGGSVVTWESQLARLEALGALTQQRHALGDANSLEDIEPIYARPPSIG